MRTSASSSTTRTAGRVCDADMRSIREVALGQETGAPAYGSKKTHHVVVYYALMPVKRCGQPHFAEGFDSRSTRAVAPLQQSGRDLSSCSDNQQKRPAWAAGLSATGTGNLFGFFGGFLGAGAFLEE